MPDDKPRRIELMRQLVIALAALSILVAACSRSHTLSDRANGTWINDFATITLDFPNHKVTSVIMGEQTTNPGLEVVSENANVVIVKDLGDVTGKTYTYVIQFQDNDHITWTKQGEEGGLPLSLHRYKPTS
jgi:hypothetical protein